MGSIGSVGPESLGVVIEIKAFWTPPGFRPMSDEAIEALCNGDGKPDTMALRAQALLIRVTDHQGER